MALSNRRRRQVSMLLRFIAIGAIAGAIYGMGVDAKLSGDLGWEGALRGLVTGALVTIVIAGFEIFFVNDPRGQWLRRLPFMKVALLKTMFYAIAIVGMDALGDVLVPINGAYPIGLNLNTLITLLVALGFTFITSTIMQINLLLGPGVLRNFIKGRYHQPRQEQRLFLFIDMRGSTAIAEKIGDIAFHRLLNQFLSDLGDVVTGHGGSIDKYVGDEMIVTWRLPDRHAAGALDAVAEARALLAERAEVYRRRFGTAPDFRAVLHAGAVVVGEMGDQKREIALLGDCINTTAKLEAWAKGKAVDVVASRAALDAMNPSGEKLDLPATSPHIHLTPLGPQLLPGKAQALDLFAIAFDQEKA